MSVHSMSDQREFVSRLETLEAEADIRRLISAHQWSNDSGAETSEIPDWTASSPLQGETQRSARWADGGEWRGSGLSEMFEGYDSTSARTTSAVVPHASWMPHMMHFLTNEWIKVTPPEKAVGRWYSWEAATVVVDGSDLAVWITGRYDATFVKERGHWRIQEMHFQEIFSTPFDSAGWTERAHVNYGPRQGLPGAKSHPSGQKPA